MGLLTPGDSLPPFTLTEFVADRRNWPWLALAAYLSTCNLVTFSVGEALDPGPGLVIAYTLCGSIGAEFAILSCWLVWGSRPLAQRCCLTLVFAIVLHTLWAFSIGHAPWSRFPLAVLLLLPACSLAVSAPLLLARVLFHWQVIDPRHEPRKVPRLGIRHLMALTALVAVALGAVRGAGRVLEVQENSAVFWMGTAIAAAAALLASGLLVLPTVWLTMRISSLVWGIVAISVLILAVSGVILSIGILAGGIPPSLAVALAPLAIIAGFVYTTAIPFWLARSAGCKLVTRRSPALQIVQ